jgi:hypothetical protein
MNNNYIYISKQLMRDYIVLKVPIDSAPLYFAYNHQTWAHLVSFGIPVDEDRNWSGIHIPHAPEAEADTRLNELITEIRQDLDQKNILYRIIP